MKTSEKLENAIVKLSKTGGHGVLITGQKILTAAHCIDVSTTGGLVMGDVIVLEVQTYMGRFRVRPEVVEPFSDVAILSCLDDQIFCDDAVAFEDFCESTKPVPLGIKPITSRQSFQVRIRDADGSWIRGKAELLDESSPMLWITTAKEVKPGASGGPVLNTAGELVAIVSHSTSLADGKSTARHPRPLKALPVWMCDEILKSL